MEYCDHHTKDNPDDPHNSYTKQYSQPPHIPNFQPAKSQASAAGQELVPAAKAASAAQSDPLDSSAVVVAAAAEPRREGYTDLD